MILPVYKGQAEPVTIRAASMYEAAELHFGDSILKISNGQAGQLYVTTKCGVKYSVRRRTELR